LLSCPVLSRRVMSCAATTDENDRVQRIGLLAQRSRTACCRPGPIDDLGRLRAKCQRSQCLCPCLGLGLGLGHGLLVLVLVLVLGLGSWVLGLGIGLGLMILMITLSCLVLSCLVLSCLVLSCLVLSCLVLSSLLFSCQRTQRDESWLWRGRLWVLHGVCLKHH
jgi:hypothetical protein